MGGRFPVPSSGWQFITSGGSVLFELACSGFRAAADGEGDIEVGLSADDFAAAVTRVYTNETDSHKATIVSWSDELTLPAGTHTLEFYPLPPTKTDVHDFCNLVILEEPS